MYRCLPLLALMVIATPMHAAPLLIDFGEAGDAPNLGGTWNTLADVNDATVAGSLDYADGSTATGITITFANWNDGSSTDQGDWNGGVDKDWVDYDAVDDYFWQFTNPDVGVSTITFSGLDKNALYDLELVAARATAGSGNRVGTYTVQGSSTTTDVSSTDLNVFTAWTNASILRWSDVAPDSNGDIVITATESGSNTVFISAIELEVVPEPASLALLSLGVIAMLSGRRRAA